MKPIVSFKRLTNIVSLFIFVISLDLKVTLRCKIEFRGDEMSGFMRIQDISERTGISKSAIRYYESKNLLRSVERNSSGYRMYSEGQVAKIKLISSLRLADIPIKDIEAYLKENDTKSKKRMMDEWIQIIRGRLDRLNVSLHYLDSNCESEQIYLIEKSEETIIWFLAESNIGQFKEHVRKRMKELKKLNIPIKSCYLNYLSGKDLIKAKIGFCVPVDTHANKLSEIHSIEHTASCICIALAFKSPISKIQDGYQKLMRYAIENKWAPTGSILECYRGEDFSDLDLLMPVTQIGKREDE